MGPGIRDMPEDGTWDTCAPSYGGGGAGHRHDSISGDWEISQRRATRKQTALPLTPHTLNVFQTSFIDCALVVRRSRPSRRPGLGVLRY